MLYHLPLEPYKERYTSQLRQWYRKGWDSLGIWYKDVLGPATVLQDQTITTGQVIDPLVRTKVSFAQIEDLLSEKLTSDDVILLDDFWTPGMEALPYTFHQLGIKPKVYAYWWAQSVDEYDFTAKMGRWMEHYELMGLEFLDGVFVACPFLKDLISVKYPNHGHKVHVVGLPFDSQEVLSRMPRNYQQYIDPKFTAEKEGLLEMPPRKNQVVFSSRWDEEKQPDFFISVAEAVKQRRPDVNFVVTTSAPKMRSNREHLLVSLDRAVQLGIVELRENQTKEQYYATLCESKVQFNCAKQDWVSFTLLEAMSAGCSPLYPYFRAFPETFGQWRQALYPPFLVDEVTNGLVEFFEEDKYKKCTPEGIWKTHNYLVAPHNETWLRMANVMGLTDQKPITKLPWEE